MNPNYITQSGVKQGTSNKGKDHATRIGLAFAVRFADMQKYRRQAVSPEVITAFRGKTLGYAPKRQDSISGYRHIYHKDLRTAAAFAQANDDVELHISDNGVEGMLYVIRGKHQADYEDVEDGFIERRDNYNEATITQQQLAEQVKTLKRDLKRAGVL